MVKLRIELQFCYFKWFGGKIKQSKQTNKTKIKYIYIYIYIFGRFVIKSNVTNLTENDTAYTVNESHGSFCPYVIYLNSSPVQNVHYRKSCL